jgi:hypothetical protein
MTEVNMENTLLKENMTSLETKQKEIIEYLDQVNKYSIYALNDFVEVFNDPSVLEGIDVKEFLKRKKIVRKMFEGYIKEFLRDHDYEISLPYYDSGIYWFYLEIRNTSETKPFRIIKNKKENFIRDSVIVLTKLADYYLYLTEKGFVYSLIWNDNFIDSNSVVKLKIESYPYDQKSQSYLLKIMSHIRDLGSSVEYDF